MEAVLVTARASRAGPGRKMTRVTDPAVVREATRKSGVVWVHVDGHPPRAVWHVWDGDADYVLHGGGEQVVPGLAEAAQAEVSVRAKSNGAGILTWLADVTTVDPAGEQWATVEPLLRKARLHAEPDPSARWRRTATLSRLSPR